MSTSLANSLAPQWVQTVPVEMRLYASDVYQASEPSRSKRVTILALSAGSSTILEQLLHAKTAIGTPQTRCREMHQSGRLETMFEMRSLPHAGSHFTCSISSRMNCRKVVGEPSSRFIIVSMLMNHCSVARKMIGLWQRQIGRAS